MEEVIGPDIEELLRTQLSGKSVLMLEDEMVFAMPLAETLYRLGVEVVQHVQRGEIAAREGSERKFDVLLLDRENPGVDGLEALRAIRLSNSGSYAAPALIVTGRMNSQAERSLGLLTGADDYVDKSVGPIEIMARIVNCLSRSGRSTTASPPSEDNGVLRNGPLIIRKPERRAYFGDQFLDLGTQSFDMLAALSESVGEPFTKSMLFEISSPHWKAKPLPDGFEHSVHKAINRLRSALEPCEAHLPPALCPLIVTLRSQGYLLRDLRGHQAP